jgi:hypothetical protein
VNGAPEACYAPLMARRGPVIGILAKGAAPNGGSSRRRASLGLVVDHMRQARLILERDG